MPGVQGDAPGKGRRPVPGLSQGLGEGDVLRTEAHEAGRALVSADHVSTPRSPRGTEGCSEVSRLMCEGVVQGDEAMWASWTIPSRAEGVDDRARDVSPVAVEVEAIGAESIDGDEDRRWGARGWPVVGRSARAASPEGADRDDGHQGAPAEPATPPVTPAPPPGRPRSIQPPPRQTSPS